MEWKERMSILFKELNDRTEIAAWLQSQPVEVRKDIKLAEELIRDKEQADLEYDLLEKENKWDVVEH
jgi:hypothetical protein